MTKNRRKQLTYLGCGILLLVIHYFWGRPILEFLSTTLFYWLISAFLALFVCDVIITIVKDNEEPASVLFFKKKAIEVYHVSEYEKEGNPLPPRDEKEANDE